MATTRCITLLVDHFNDHSEFSELMFGIIHLLESFDDESYIKELIKVSPKLFEKAPGWASTLFIRIMNHPPSLFILREVLNNINEANPERQAVASILGYVKVNEPALIEKVNIVLN
ncbi:Imm30 family immunity protein [Xanthocytophaga flava]|uniref:Imm30 family immunity protein n=1 Tax=Xanthocytophaga flava TaxID=3048013 RepID=UPI0028D53CB5|nr:Imm30 family immunity protein [Xanthocytophaga flavus]